MSYAYACAYAPASKVDVDVDVDVDEAAPVASRFPPNLKAPSDCTCCPLSLEAASAADAFFRGAMLARSPARPLAHPPVTRRSHECR